jgi:hypothetical protein
MVIRMGFDQVHDTNQGHRNHTEFGGPPPHFFNYLKTNAARLGLQVMATRSEELASGTESWLYVIPVKSDQLELLFTPGNGFWEHLPEHVRKAVIAKRCAIVLDNLLEGDAGPGLFDTHMNPYLKTVPVSSRQVGYVSSALNGANLYDNCPKLRWEKPQMQVASCSHWEAQVATDFEHRHGCIEFSDKLYLSFRDYTECARGTTDRPKSYLCLNGALRNHRVAVVSLLAEYGLLESGLVSLAEAVHPTTAADVLLNGLDTWDKHIHFVSIKRKLKGGFAKLRPLLPLCVDQYRQNIDTNEPLSARFYLDTYFSIITETFYNNRCIFPTEKVFKPILHLHPFVAVAPQGYLQGLRDLGYQTFDPMIDESYDKISNNTSRLKAIMSEVRRLCSLSPVDRQVMYASLFKTLEHNANHLINLRGRQTNLRDQALLDFVGVLISNKGSQR